MSDSPNQVVSGPPRLTVAVLGDEAKVFGPGVDAVVTGTTTHPLIACLAMAWPRFLRRWEIAERIDWSPSDEAFQKQISRLRALGIPIETKREHGYRLDAVELDVDMSDFVSLATSALDRRTADAALKALEHWAGELPSGVAQSPLFQEVIDLRQEMRALATLRPKRVLVVEDRLGAAIDQGLREGYNGEIEVLVADSYEQFVEVEDELETFDIVLVDFHLGGNDDQFLGLTVADRIKGGGTVVPVIGMSYARPGAKDDVYTALKHDLWAFVAKASSADTNAVSDIVSMALSFLNTESTMIDHYAQRTEALANRARRRIQSERATPEERKVQTTKVEKDLGNLRDALGRRDIRRLRRLAVEFYEHWCR